MSMVPRLGFGILAALVFVGGCPSARPVQVPGKTGASPNETARADPVYDPSVPLEARVTPLGGSGIRTYQVRYRGNDGESVPGLLMLPWPRQQRVPAVILLHGLGGSKGDLFLPALALARRGYASLAIDMAGHGERTPIENTNPDTFALPQLRRASLQTVTDLRRGMDLLETRPEIDATRIGFIGVSLGGILGAVFVAQEPRVRTAVLWSAGGDWARLVAESTHPFAQRLRADGAVDLATIRAQLSEVDPVRSADRIAPRPLLMLHGTRDTTVPAACARALYQAARPPKRLVWLPGGHVPEVSTMLHQTLAWLDQNTKKGT